VTTALRYVYLVVGAAVLVAGIYEARQIGMPLVWPLIVAGAALMGVAALWRER
jgi:hypothetical protein